jgi:predicted  nucleic acid-binding Zn-ribbon protein
MKHQAILLSVLSVAAFTFGCDKQQTASEQLEKAKAEAKEAAQDMKDYTFAKKAEFVQQMESQLTALNQDLDKLSAKIESSSDAVKAEAKPKLQALRGQASQLNKRLDEVKNASESTWDTVKAGAQKAYDGLANGVRQARQWVSDKIAP